MIMRVSDICFSKIQEFEGLRLTAYKCPAGVWTIGFGHTKGVKMGQTITKAQAESLLRGDLLPCEEYVRGLNLELTQGQFDALVDFCFNAGTDALRRSTLLQRVRSYLALDIQERAGSPLSKAIREEFGRWVYSKGQRLAGLERRRAWEAVRFFEE
jgi:lysozyme